MKRKQSPATRRSASTRRTSPGAARKRRRIAVVTGTRAEYGLLESTMIAIDAHAKLELQLVVTGAHLLRKFGRTVDQIVADGWPIAARVRMQTGNDGDPLDHSNGLARGVSGMARYFHEAATDIVLVLGDRIEAMAGALAGLTSGRFVAHIHGGDVAPGDFDDGLRHAITKLAHIHFPAIQSAADRLIRLGEQPAHVHPIGAPGIDRIRRVLAETPHDALRKQDVALVMMHPTGRSAAQERRAMEALLRAVYEANLASIVVYPNSDRGHQGIIDAIGSARAASNGSMRVVRNLAPDDYIRTLAASRVLVGNSSSGIIEAASAGTPAVNIGDRQAGRQRSGDSVIDCTESRAAIREAIGRSLRKRIRPERATCYGDGAAGRRIAAILARKKLDQQLRRKLIAY